MSLEYDDAAIHVGVARNGILKPAPSQQFSDCLYSFAGTPERFYAALKNKGFTLNYVDEDVRYLHIEGLEHLAIAMLCFCDIPTERHRMLPHLKQYGRYGIGLSKDWGISRGVQPVHYLSGDSPFCDDLREAYSAALEINNIYAEDSPEATISAFLATTLAYAKPTYEERSDNKRYEQGYSFEDECEWRFVPRDLYRYKVILSNPDKSDLKQLRSEIRKPDTYSLPFEYTDITDLIVPPGRAVDEMVAVIQRLPTDSLTKKSLKMKVRVI